MFMLAEETNHLENHVCAWYIETYFMSLLTTEPAFLKIL